MLSRSTDYIAEFKAGFDNTPESEFINVPIDCSTDVHSIVTPIQLEQIHRGELTNGTHTLKIQVHDTMSDETSTQEFTIHIHKWD